MKNQLVDTSVQVLGVFSSHNDTTGMSVNKIIEKTGSSDRKRVTDSIRHLVRAQLLETRRSLQHSQVRLKSPTALGIEFLKLMKNIEGYSDACIKCRDKLEQIRDISKSNDGKANKSKLKEIGWTDEEINSYDHIIHYTSVVLDQLIPPHEIINVILIRYLSLLTKLSINGNEIAKHLLYQIVMNEISHFFSLLIKRPRYSGFGDIEKIDALYDMLTVEKWNNVIGSTVRSRFLDYKFINKEFREMQLRTLRILTPTKELIDREIASLREEEKARLDANSEIEVARQLGSVRSFCEEAYYSLT